MKKCVITVVGKDTVGIIEIGVVIKCQREEIFDMMHRI